MAYRHHSLYLLLAVVAAGLVACGETADPSDEASVAQSTPARGHLEQAFDSYELYETDAAVQQWTLNSDFMQKYSGLDHADLQQIKMVFFDDGVYHATLVADSGTAKIKNNDVHVWGHVVITTATGRRLRTSELFFTNADGYIRNEVYNVFDRGDDVITGYGLEATPDLDYFMLKRQNYGVVVDDETDVPETPGDSP